MRPEAQFSKSLLDAARLKIPQELKFIHSLRRPFMAWSETLGQVMPTRPVLAYGASYLGGVVVTASP